MIDIIEKYFPEFSQDQLKTFDELIKLYQEWNTQINLISRKDMDNLAERHILHSLALHKLNSSVFKPANSVMDIGTGGGFPGLPLAILNPEVKFYLIDGSAKKIKVVSDIVTKLSLKNVHARQIRAEDWPGPSVNIIITRAVTNLNKLQEYNKKINQDSSLADLYAWKGGDLTEEISQIAGKYKVKQFNLAEIFSEEFFETKKIVKVYPR